MRDRILPTAMGVEVTISDSSLSRRQDRDDLSIPI
jgi:hypothetical protein